MKRVDAVISLVNSLSKSEKKHISQQVVQGQEGKDYLLIYDLIAGSRRPDGSAVKAEFLRRRPGASFEVSVQYLYDKLLEALLPLRRQRDTTCDLLNDLGKVRMLYDRSLFEECFELLGDTILTAREHENYEMLLIAQKLELEYLLRLNFPAMTEQELYHRHFILNDALKKIRDITEQSALHNLLKWRLSRRSIRTAQQKQAMNDLVINESCIVSSSAERDNFELMRNHRLFQANYLMGTGDRRAALEAYKELDRLFDENPRRLENPPIYYLSVIEGALAGLRSTGCYDEMPYFLDKLRALVADAQPEFRINATCLLFQYELFPYMDRGDFAACSQLMERYREELYEREAWLSPIRRSELLLYTALVHLGMQRRKEAKQCIGRAMIDHNIKYLPLMRTIRLVQLIVYYELGETELIRHESRSVVRKLASPREQTFRTERLILRFLNRKELPVLRREREAYREKIAPLVEEIYNDKYERQLLCLFDFIAWMDSRILKIPLGEALARRQRCEAAPEPA